MQNALIPDLYHSISTHSSENARSQFALEATFSLLSLEGFAFIFAIPILHIWCMQDVCALKGQTELLCGGEVRRAVFMRRKVLFCISGMRSHTFD